MSALLPCPFCGDVAYLDAAQVDDPSLEPEDQEVVAWSVGCSCCAFHGPHLTEETATAAWNTRNGVAQFSAVDALAGVMDILCRAESNASGNPEWDYVGPRVAAARAAIAKALGRTPNKTGDEGE